MALKLSDIKKHNGQRVKFDTKKLFNQNQDDGCEQIEKGIRPWQSVDDKKLIVRTFAAKEAVKKARKIVERNERMSQFICDDRSFIKETEQQIVPPQKRTDKLREFFNFYFR